MKKILTHFMSVYQKTLSPDHSKWGKHRFPNGYCRYYPSCSEYTKQSLQKKGVFFGLAAGVFRILRCNPWSDGGVDLVSQTKEPKNLGT